MDLLLKKSRKESKKAQQPAGFKLRTSRSRGTYSNRSAATKAISSEYVICGFFRSSPLQRQPRFERLHPARASRSSVHAEGQRQPGSREGCGGCRQDGDHRLGPAEDHACAGEGIFLINAVIIRLGTPACFTKQGSQL